MNRINLNNTVNFQANPTDVDKITKNALLFYTGVHTDSAGNVKEYKTEDLQKIVESFVDPVPVQLSHSHDAHDTVGLVKSIWLSENGDEIHGKVEILGKENVNKVKLGLWSKVSLGLTFSYNEPEILELSITPFPSLERARLYQKKITNGGGNNLKKTKTEEKKIEETVPAETTEKVEESVQEFQQTKEDVKESKMVKAEEQEQSEFEKMQSEFQLLKAEKAELQKKLQYSADKDIVEGYIKTGKTTPAMKDLEIKLFNSLDAEQRKTFEELKDKSPVLIEGKTFNTNKIEDKKAKYEEESDGLLKHTSARFDN